MRRLEGAEEASLFIGDPRLPENNIDRWWNSLLSETSPPFRRPHLYGADAGYCARKNVFNSLNDTIPFSATASSTAYMRIGDAIENMLAEGLKKHDLLVAQNMRLVELPGLKVSGKIDLICLDNHDRLALIEVKSCGDLPLRPRIGHLIQVQSYAAISGFDNVHIVYVSRNVRSTGWGNDADIKTFPVEMTPEVIFDRLQVAAFSNLSIQAGRLPPVPATFKKSTHCSYCPFTHFCWEGVEPTIERLDAEEYDRLIKASQKVAAKLLLHRQQRYLQTLKACREFPLPEKLIAAIDNEIEKAQMV